MSNPRVLVVDDESSVRQALERAFRSEGFDVRTEADGSTLADVTKSFRPDVAILDVRLPVGPDGYTMARMLRDEDLPVVLLTAADSVDDRLAGFEAGADDHVGKPFSTAELIARTQALLRRSGRLTPKTVQIGDIAVDDATRSVTRGDEVVDLTRTEYDLLLLLARHAGQILSKQQLLIQLWGFDAFDPNVIEVHVSALRRKLEAHGPRVIHTVRSFGYILRV
ncbi:MAG TPA: response regulator transcription factor [Acidimicrobiales bacterium]|nr:response regulator transcription factor [Acidimicrobiales bacterium]